MDFRDSPANTGTPISIKRPRCRSSSRLCSSVFPKPKPGSITNLSNEIPASCAAFKRSCRKSFTSVTTSSRYRGLVCMLCGSPCICMRQAATLPAATTSSAPVARSALTSLIMTAPACIAASITSGFEVSTEMGISLLARACTTGITRRNSSAALTESLPGRVDSPPISSIPAPSSIKRAAWQIALSVKAYSPPSEKESGVTLTTPMMMGRRRERLNLPH